MSENAVKLIDLFSGAGGLTLGFRRHFGDRLEVVWANDFDEAAAATYNANFGHHCDSRDIVDLLDDPDFEVPEAHIVVGGPPCQGFSLLNKNREADPRKQLWRPYLDVVDRSEARIFLIENVRQLITSSEYDEIVDVAQELGFSIWSDVLLAADYGVPQMRYRAFIVGCRDTDPAPYFPPKCTHYNPEESIPLGSLFHIEDPQPYRTVRDAIEDLPAPVGTAIRDEDPPLDLHFHRNPTELSEKRYRVVSEEGMNRFDLQRLAPELTPQCWINKKSGGTDLFGRMWWDRPSVTIRTEFYKPEKGRYLHPEQHRPITHREGARLQSFPDSFVFHGSKIRIARQIGNAVPPLLAQRMAESIDELIRVSVPEHA